MAHDLIHMFDELCRARKEIWKLKRELRLADGLTSQGIDNTPNTAMLVGAALSGGNAFKLAEKLTPKDKS